MTTLDSPIPLADLESVLAWVDTFKLTRQCKKINRDFSDAVLLAEMLSVHYPKLVEMHNYPPRNGQALKLNNWMTLNRKVLKKLRLNLCCNTMEQLANCAPGVIERVLLMVRDKIRRDEELNKSVKDAEQNMSSGGSYYEACGEDDNILVVPVKTRVNGVLETIQQKVVSLDIYQALKEELKDAKDAADLLKQKVEHLDDLMKLKDERIDELQKQLDRKQARRKEVEAYQNSLSVPFDTVQSPVVADILPATRKSSHKLVDPITKLTESMGRLTESNGKVNESNSKLNEFSKANESYGKFTESIGKVNESNGKLTESIGKIPKEESKIPIPKTESGSIKSISKHSISETSKQTFDSDERNIETVQSDVFIDIKSDEEPDIATEVIKMGIADNGYLLVQENIVINEKGRGEININTQDYDEFKDSSQEGIVTTIGATIQNEIRDIISPCPNTADISYILNMK